MSTLHCELKDFQEFIPDLPPSTELINSESTEVHFPGLVEEASLTLDCLEEMWVRSGRRKYFRKVLYARFSIFVLGQDFLIYHICND